MLGLLAALRPGGSAIVTAWAREQAEPERTLRRWTHIGGDGGAEGGEESEAPSDYFVPWHVPLHRPEAGASVRLAEAAS